MSCLDEYLSSLPDGFRSFGRAQVKDNVIDEQLEWLDELGAPLDPRIAVEVRRIRPLGRTMQWVPEVINAAVAMSIRDVYGAEGEWLRALYERQRVNYRRPLYRALLLVMSPTLLTMGAGDRYKAYRRGSELSVDRWRRTTEGIVTTATLTFPPGLLNRLMIRGRCEVLRAAIDAAGAKDSAVSIDDEKPGEARLRLFYRT